MIQDQFFLKFDRSSFRAFYAAAIELNFTRAANLSGATQSGVSQHVAKLENELGTSLFIRSREGLRITEAGKMLKNYLEKIFVEEELFLEAITASTSEVSGTVNYSMPESCLISPHFSKMLKLKSKSFPKINLNVTIQNSNTILNQVIGGDIDFGFVTNEVDSALVTRVEFCKETYILCGSSNQMPSTTVLETPFINHPDFEVYFSAWHKTQWPRKKVPPISRLSFSGQTNSLSACLTMMAGGLGYSLVPEHCAQTLIDDGQLFRITSKKDILNSISIIYRKNLTLPKRVSTVVDTFLGFY